MGWIELFYDLVFVVVVSQLAHGLATEVTAHSFGVFVLLFVPAWWLWIGMTFYAERFETMDVSHRLATFVAMLPVVALAVSVHHGLPGGGTGYALAYAAGRTIIITMWLRGGIHEPAARPMTQRFAVGFGLSVVAFVVSIWIVPPWRYVVWGAGLLARLMNRVPWIVWPGGGLLGYVGGEMLIEDPFVRRWLGEMTMTPQGLAPIIIGLSITAYGWWFARGHRLAKLPKNL